MCYFLTLFVYMFKILGILIGQGPKCKQTRGLANIIYPCSCHLNVLIQLMYDANIVLVDIMSLSLETYLHFGS
jgi:hypothetical protein